VTGTVDNSGRALLRIRLRHPTSGKEAESDAWVDTGFTGELVLPQHHVLQLDLPLGPAVPAGLADGSQVELDTYTCLLHWFGEWKRIEIDANQGRFPLLGVGLLLDHELKIDYCGRKLTVV
jgi:clan AA aspartic protease